MMLITSEIQAAAFDYAARGWAVMPLKPCSKEPHFDLIKNAYKGASFDLGVIETWFDIDPNANIGIACITSGLIVLDVDFRNGGFADPSWHGTYTVQTGNGLHFYFIADPVLNFAGTYDKGIDVKWRGYVAAAPSIHPNTSRYVVINDVEPLPLPEDVRERIAR